MRCASIQQRFFVKYVELELNELLGAATMCIGACLHYLCAMAILSSLSSYYSHCVFRVLFNEYRFQQTRRFDSSLQCAFYKQIHTAKCTHAPNQEIPFKRILFNAMAMAVMQAFSQPLTHTHITKVCCSSARLFINCNQVYCSFNSITNLFEIPLT